MLPKILLFLLGLTTLSCVVNAQSWIKKVHTLQPHKKEEVSGYNRVHFQLAWEFERLDMLTLFLRGNVAPDVNLTLIGWQNVLNDDGSIKEVDTVQLVFPPIPQDLLDQFEIKDDIDDNYEVDEDPFTEIRKVIEPLEAYGFASVSAVVEKFSRNGEEKEFRYADGDEVYSIVDGFAIYNKTATVNQQEVANIVKNLKPTILGEPTVLRYDGDGKLIADQSNIQPYLLGTVIDHYEAPESVILSGPEIIARISQQYPREEIAKQLGTEFNKVFSDYRWRVLVNPQHHYVTRDVDVTLTYDNFDLNGGNNDEYFVYGIKRINVVTK